MESIETDKFILTNIEYKHQESKEKSLMPPKLIRTGIKSALIRCKKCDHMWRGYVLGGNGLSSQIGGIYIIECQNEKCRVRERNVNLGS